MKKLLSFISVIAICNVAIAAPLPLFTGPTGANPANEPVNIPDLNTIVNNINSSSFASTSINNANILHNGQFAIDQRNETAAVTITSGGGNLMTVDRWQGNFAASSSGAGNPTIQQVAATTGLNLSPKELKITANSSQGTTSPAALNFILQQQIEGSDVADLGFGIGGTSVSYSFIIKASVAGVYGVYLQNGASNRSYVQECNVAVANTAQTCSGTFPADTTGTWNRTRGTIGAIFGIALSGGSTFQTTAGAWTAGAYETDSNQVQLTNNSSATVEIGRVKLERGNFSTAYSEDINLTLQKISRFYWKSFPVGTAPANNAGLPGAICALSAAAKGVADQLGPFNLYASPTVTTYNPSAANANWRDVTGSADLAATVDPSTAKSTTGVEITSADASAADHNICIQASLDTGY